MSVLSWIWSVKQPRYRQPGTLTIDGVAGGEATALGGPADTAVSSMAARLVAFAMDEAQAMASESWLEKHSGMQVLHPPHEENLLIQAYVGSQVVKSGPSW